MNALYVKILVYVFVGLFSFRAFCQNQKTFDSLKNIIESNIEVPDTLLCRLYTTMAYNSSSPNDKIDYGEKALEEAERIDSPIWKAASCMHIGDGNRLKGNLSKAISQYIRAAELYLLIEENLGVAAAYLNVGGVYLYQDNFENSNIYYQKSINIFRVENDSNRLATALLNVGELYREYKKYDSAKLYFKESGNIFDRLNSPIGKAYNLGNIGLIFAEQGKHALAETNMTQAIEIFEVLGNRYPIAAYETSLAEIYAQRGDMVRALGYAKSSLKIADEEGLKEQSRDASLKLSELHAKLDDFEKAYFYQSQYLVYRDSINNEETIRKMADLRTEYEVSKKQVEVDFLNRQSDSRQIILFGMLLVFLLISVLAYVLYKLYKLRGRAIIISGQRRRLMATQRNTLEELNNTKDKFFSIISHDIRGPVNNFNGVAFLIKAHLESGEIEELVKIGQMLEKSSIELSSLLDNLLDWAMGQQGKFPLKMEKLDIAEVCNTNLAMMENMAQAKQIELTARVESQIKLHADLNSVSTIVRNLLSNAIKFTKQGGAITLVVGTAGKMGTIEIKDTGVGIPEAKMKSIFGFKGERSQWGTDGEKGVGLGLNLVHEFLEMNHGKIKVESEEGVGTSFTVYLPLAERSV